MNVWFAVNKNGWIGLYLDEPVRNNKTGKWESKHPYINSLVNQKITEFIQKTQMTWEHEPECLNINAKE